MTGSAPSEGGSMAQWCGLTGDEVVATMIAARQLVCEPKMRSAMAQLEDAAPGAGARMARALLDHAFANGLSRAGQGALCQLASRPGADPADWHWVLENVLAPPPHHRDLAEWWLLFSALAATLDFKTGPCARPHPEPALSAALVQCLAAAGRTWAGLLGPMLNRTRAQLAVHHINLEVLGGEQATGGDFALVLDFDGRTSQPGLDVGHRIVPLIFQAKRYRRPSADISQHHPVRGYQHAQLVANPCASAFLLLENGDGVTEPLLPLVKPARLAHHPGRTDVRADTFDLATYLLCVLKDETAAPRAPDAASALRMIYAAADPSHLGAILMLSPDPGANARYQSALALLAGELIRPGERWHDLHDS